MDPASREACSSRAFAESHDGTRSLVLQESFVDMCHSAIKHGVVPKTEKYKAWEESQPKD